MCSAGVSVLKIGSAAIFGPTIAYLLSPASRKPGPHVVHTISGHGEPKAPAETVESQPEPMAESEAAQPESIPEETVTDDEGTAVSAKEVAESAAQAVAFDPPTEASEAEVKGETFDAGNPGQDAEAEKKPDQTEKAHDDPKSGTVQSPDATGPTDLGAARQQSKEGKRPKEASDSS
ncbi:hypothetical protein EWM64_g5054 [Hericium alpestre]|uniref:Uncharacterized protein n=1 Tax=Hericium alpestre TaxID=135208 RepID=A0A4Y9ZY50_9AGAM|nr:hypothetical protein EWM64_g5054 [Hericium alpestre]